MANFNKVLLMGNLTRDVEVRYSQAGVAVGKFGLAVNQRFKGKDGEQRESVVFVDLVAFGNSADTLAKYIGKGDPLFVEGRLNLSQWEGRDGEQRSKLEVVVEGFQFLGSKQGRKRDEEPEGEPDEEERPRRKPKKRAEPQEPVDYGDIPF